MVIFDLQFLENLRALGCPEYDGIFDLQFLKNLHDLACPEYDFSIFTKCLSVCLSVYEGQKFFWLP